MNEWMNYIEWMDEWMDGMEWMNEWLHNNGMNDGKIA